MKKKILCCFLSVLLVIVNVLPTSIHAIVKERGVDLSSSKVIDHITISPSEVNNGDDVVVSVDFSEKSGQSIHSGDTIHMKLPNDRKGSLKAYTNTIKLRDSSGVELGTVYISQGEVRIVFSNEVEELSDVSGHFKFTCVAENNTGKWGTTPEKVTINTNFGIAGIPDTSVTINPSDTVGPGGGKYPFYYKTGRIDLDQDKKVTWWLNANLNEDYLKSDIVIEDEIQKGQEMLWDEGQFSIHSDTNRDPEHNCTLTPKQFVEKGYGTIEWIDNNPNHFRITINQEKIHHTSVVFRYRTKITNIYQETFDNKSNVKYQKYYDEKPTEKESDFKVKNVYLDGSIDGKRETINFFVMKKWDDDHNRDGVRPKSIQVRLYADDTLYEEITLNDANNWQYEWERLPKKIHKKEIKYHVEEVTKDSHYTTTMESKSDNAIITNHHTPEKVNLRGTKIWEDDQNRDGVRPKEIILHLYADGVELKDKKQVVKGNETAEQWQYEFKDLPKYKDGKEIQYTVSEEQIPNYITRISGMNITNTHAPNKTTISVQKRWDDSDNQDGIRPNDIKVQLYANGTIPVGNPVLLSEENHWQYTWEALSEKENGKKINYSVKELEQVPGYTATISETSPGRFEIVNTHKPEETKISGKKVWMDQKNKYGKRPEEITIHLYADGVEVKEQKIKGSGGEWDYSFEHLPKYKNGKKIIYTVTEDKIPNYTGKIEGTTIINTLSYRETDVTVMKRWDDSDNQDGVRPKKVEVQLYADARAKGKSIILDESNNWQYTWNHLPEKSKGKNIDYTVKEINVDPNYKSVITQQKDDTYVISNQHEVEKTSIKGEKIWKDQSNKDKKRPEKIIINLYANEKRIAQKEVTGTDDHWSYEFTNLPKFEEGKEIQYSVKEEPIDGYQTEIQGTTITNTYKPETTQISVEKEWDDNNNIQKLRPTEVKIQLYANGKKYQEPIILNEKNHWQYTWNDLPLKDKEKKDIVYTIKEVTAINGYNPEIVKENKNEYVIINHLTKKPPMPPVTPPVTPPEKPETIEIRGEKVWEDHHNQDGVRPESIEIHLYANGKEVAKKEVTGTDDHWSYEFTNLPKFEEGKEIQYTVTEDKIPNYTGKIEGTTITNTHAPNETHLTVMKRWEDNNDEDKKRPEAIKVQLYADGKEKGEPVFLNEENQWSYTWSHLPEKVDGKKVKYEVKEVTKVLGYETSQKVGEDGTVVITNTYTKPPKPPVPPVTPLVESSDTESTKEDTTESSVPAESTETTTPIESTETTKPVESTETTKPIESTESTETTSSTHSTESSTTEESESSTSPSSESTREGGILPPKTSSSAKLTKEEHKEKGKLPQTGTRSSLEFILVGWALVSSAVILFFLYKKYRS